MFINVMCYIHSESYEFVLALRNHAAVYPSVFLWMSIAKKLSLPKKCMREGNKLQYAFVRFKVNENQTAQIFGGNFFTSIHTKQHHKQRRKHWFCSVLQTNISSIFIANSLSLSANRHLSGFIRLYYATGLLRILVISFYEWFVLVSFCSFTITTKYSSTFLFRTVFWA